MHKKKKVLSLAKGELVLEICVVSVVLDIFYGNIVINIMSFSSAITSESQL